jgi:hypothetical protein
MVKEKFSKNPVSRHQAQGRRAGKSSLVKINEFLENHIS